MVLSGKAQSKANRFSLLWHTVCNAAALSLSSTSPSSTLLANLGASWAMPGATTALKHFAELGDCGD